MCLLYILGIITILFAVISGQYSDHQILFWATVASLVLSGFFYSIYRRCRVDREGIGDKMMIAIEFIGGTICFASFVLFIWFSVVVWI